MMAGGDRPVAPPPPPPPAGPTGSIYDIGYRGYDGPRLGRRHAFTTLFVGGVRATGRKQLPRSRMGDAPGGRGPIAAKIRGFGRGEPRLYTRAP